LGIHVYFARLCRASGHRTGSVAFWLPTGAVTYRGVTLQYDPTLDRVWVTDDGFTASIKASEGSYAAFNRQGSPTQTTYATLDGGNNYCLTATGGLGGPPQCSVVQAYIGDWPRTTNNCAPALPWVTCISIANGSQ
jgi:hypothetical protein